MADLFYRFTRLSGWQVFLLMAFLGFLAYANAVRHPFVHDDIVFIEKNPYLADLNIKNFLLQTSVPDSGFPLVNQYYRPFLEMLNRLLYRLFGRNPHAFHFFNICLHILNGFLVWLLFDRLTDGRKGIALAAGLIFLLHPLQSEAVACVSGISNLVLTFFGLLTFLTYLQAVHSMDPPLRKRVMYGSSLFFLSCAIFSKEQAVVFPVLIVFYELCCAPNFSKKFVRAALPSIGLFAVLAGYFLLRKFLFGAALTPVMDSPRELGLRILAIPRTLLVYFGIMFFPHDLHYYRSQDILLPFGAHFLGLIFLSLFGYALFKRVSGPQRSWIIFGTGWFFITLLPTLNIVPLINEYSLILTAEHFLYLPLAGMLLAVISAVHFASTVHWGDRQRAAALWVFTVILGLFMAMTVWQNRFWRGEVPLFERTLRFEPKFGRAHSLLAKAYASEGRFQDAVKADERALRIFRSYAGKIQHPQIKEFYLNFIKWVSYHKGYCLNASGDLPGSMAAFKEALQADPEDAQLQYTVGLWHLKIREIGQAIGYFEKARALDPENLMVINSLAICYKEIGEYSKARPLLEMIVEKDPGSAAAQRNLDNLLMHIQKGQSPADF